jgi:hypothetical protein
LGISYKWAAVRGDDGDATRRRRRPKTRWLDDLSTDLKKMGIKEWRDRARDRQTWRNIVNEAKEMQQDKEKDQK